MNAEKFLKVKVISWAEGNWDFSPDAFVQQFIDLLQKESKEKFSGTTIEIAKEILKDPDFDYFWRKVYNLDVDGMNDYSVFLEFRDRFRGFSDSELEVKKTECKAKLEENIKKIDGVITAVQNLITNLKRDEKGKYFVLSEKLEMLSQWKTDWQEFNSEAKLLIRAAGILQREKPRFKSFGFGDFFADMDMYLFDSEDSIKKLFSFPFRHMEWLYVKPYREAERIFYKNGQDIKGAINRIIDDIGDPMSIYDSFVDNAPFLLARKPILTEVRRCIDNQLFTAASLILFSQIEGIILDFAKEIDGKTFMGTKMQIFEPGSNYKSYINRRDGKPHNYLSIETILFESFLRNFLSPDFLEFFSTDFYSERCHYAHGENITPTSKTDFQALLFFALTVFFTYQEFQRTQKPDPLSKLGRSS